MRTRILGIVLAVVLAIGGAVVLTAYVNGADARALAGTRTVQAYVVTTRIPAETPAAQLQSYIKTEDIPAVAAVDGRVLALSSLDGEQSNSVIEPGEQLLTARFSKPSTKATDPGTLPAGMQALTLKLPLEQAVGGSLVPGDRVGVVVAMDSKTVRSVHGVQVLKVQLGETTTQGSSGAVAAPATVQLVTLAVKPDVVAQVVAGQKFGAVWLSKETTATPASSSSAANGAATR